MIAGEHCVLVLKILTDGTKECEEKSSNNIATGVIGGIIGFGLGAFSILITGFIVRKGLNYVLTLVNNINVYYTFRNIEINNR